MGIISAKNITKIYKASTFEVNALAGVDLEVEEGEMIAIMGPSGCGKTTVLRAIAGFENPTTGEIVLNGKKLNGPRVFVEPEKRQIGMVFQDIA